MPTAIETVDRAVPASPSSGVPNETRKGLPDGTTIFERVLPGPDRMYPDTDSSPIPIEEEAIEATRARLPQAVDARRRCSAPGALRTTFTPTSCGGICARSSRRWPRTGVDPEAASTLLGHHVRHAMGDREIDACARPWAVTRGSRGSGASGVRARGFSSWPARAPTTFRRAIGSGNSATTERRLPRAVRRRRPRRRPASRIPSRSGASSRDHGARPARSRGATSRSATSRRGSRRRRDERGPQGVQGRGPRRARPIPGRRVERRRRRVDARPLPRDHPPALGVRRLAPPRPQAAHGLQRRHRRAARSGTSRNSAGARRTTRSRRRSSRPRPTSRT